MCEILASPRAIAGVPLVVLPEDMGIHSLHFSLLPVYFTFVKFMVET